MKRLFIILLLASFATMNAQDDSTENIQLVENANLIFQGHKINFEKVISDSRCPSDVTCVMAGWAMVKINLVENGGKNKRSFELKIPATINGSALPLILDNQKGLLVVQNLTPYPISSEAFATREYCLNLVWIPN